MTETEVMNDVTAVLRDVFDNPTLAITSDSNAKTVPGWDSMKQIMVMMAVEEEKFDIVLSTRDMGRVRNIGDLVEAIMSKTKK
ncbi:MAG: acyl carrier protein [Proteobacteria bacterium]|nr:acyl carrier protein [Pseudomonadota bacterium]